MKKFLVQWATVTDAHADVEMKRLLKWGQGGPEWEALRCLQRYIEQVRARAEKAERERDEAVVQNVFYQSEELERCGDGWMKAEAELAAARAELAEDETLRNRMSDLLTRTANALKGEPGPLTLHDWSDLPERAGLIVVNEARLIAEVERLKPVVEAAVAWRRGMASDSIHGDGALLAVLHAYLSATEDRRTAGGGPQ